MLQTFSWRSPSQRLPELNLQLLQVPEHSLGLQCRARLPLLLHIPRRSFRLIGNHFAASSFWSLARRYTQILLDLELFVDLQIPNFPTDRVLGNRRNHIPQQLMDFAQTVSTTKVKAEPCRQL